MKSITQRPSNAIFCKEVNHPIGCAAYVHKGYNQAWGPILNLPCQSDHPPWRMLLKALRILTSFASLESLVPIECVKMTRVEPEWSLRTSPIPARPGLPLDDLSTLNSKIPIGEERGGRDHSILFFRFQGPDSIPPSQDCMRSLALRSLNSLLAQSQTQSLYLAFWNNSPNSEVFPSKILEYLSFQMVHKIAAGIISQANLLLLLRQEETTTPWQQPRS